MRKKLAGIMQKLKWLDPFTYVDLALDKYWPAKNSKKTGVQEIGYNIIYLVCAFVFAFAIYQIFAIGLQTASPIVIVVSESMEPTLYRGDVVFIKGENAVGIKAQEVILNQNLSGKNVSEFLKSDFADSSDSQVGLAVDGVEIDGKKTKLNTEGDIVVYYSTINGAQIIHRAVLKIKANDGVFFLTKGDNKQTNWSIDQEKTCLKFPDGKQACYGPITEFPINSKDIQGKSVLKIPIIGCVKVWVFDDFLSLISQGKMPSNYRGGLC